MRLKHLIILVGLIGIVSGRVAQTKLPQSNNKAPIVLRQDVEEYNDSDNAVDGNVSESNAVEETDASAEAANVNVEEESNSEDNQVLQEINQVPQEVSSEAPVVNVDDANPINRYCKCTTYECNCCRDFALPLIPIKGPGCAAVQYLDGNRMSIGIKFGDRVLANRVISGRKATPVCMPLPGGFNRFCGRIYSISRRSDDHFKACLGLELRADNEVEAVLRVSCFKFGPRGLSVTEPEPLPPVEDVDDEDEDDEDDDEDEGDDLLGSLGLGEDDDEDEEEDDDDDDDDGAEQDEPDTPASEAGFSLLEGDFLGDLLGTTSQKKKKTANKVEATVAATKAATDKKKSKKQDSSAPVVPEVVKKNATVTKTKKKDENTSDDITDIVASLVSGDDDDSSENDEDDDDDEDEEDDGISNEKDGVTEVTKTPSNDEDEDEYEESGENDEADEKQEIEEKQPKQPKYAFSWSNLTRLFRIL
ncbi:uncharacterized protein LOC129738697 isoform X2 [Uranotaenia lowii]|uniref:uncharacterized protein LOC129738697 isoform X2 n=1 Tax=Uranotaenia lowii TaxID=190385 RepID=UPI00247A5075|nr:uncharacterized protein LOC129738697 isoform X2 [Uranotaenia lowii]